MLLAFLLCAGLAACETPKDMPLDSIRNTKTGSIISLGMSQGEAEKVLGKGTYLETTYPLKDNSQSYENIYDPDSNAVTYTYGSAEDLIMIMYENDSITCMWTSADTVSSNWCLKHGMTHGNTAQDVFHHYGKTTIHTADSANNIDILSYDYNASGNRVEDTSASYTIAFFLKDNKILFFSLGSV